MWDSGKGKEGEGRGGEERGGCTVGIWHHQYFHHYESGILLCAHAYIDCA